MAGPSAEAYQRWQKMAAAIARSYLKDPTRSEDLLHDGIQNLSRSGYEIDDTITDALLRTTLHNRAKDLLREQKRRPTTVVVEHEHPDTRALLDPDASAEQLRAALRAVLDDMYKRFDAESGVDYWAVFLVRLRSSVGRSWLTHEELERSAADALNLRFKQVLPWHPHEDARRIQHDWAALERVWARCVEIIKRDGLLRPGALCEGLEGLAPTPPPRNTWTQWESRARREAGLAVLHRDATILAELIELMERDVR
jgi:hypothetical protein